MSSITINGTNTWDDYGAIMTSKDVSPPEIKTITEELPYADGFIDFTRLDGKIHYKPRNLTYVFEFLESSKSLLTEITSSFINWLYSLGECDIYDEDIEDWHFRGVMTSCKESVQGVVSKITVTFTAEPYMISNGGERIVLMEITPAKTPDEYIFLNFDGSLKYATVGTIAEKFTTATLSEDGLTAVVTYDTLGLDNSLIYLPGAFETVKALPVIGGIYASRMYSNGFYTAVKAGTKGVKITITFKSAISEAALSNMRLSVSTLIDLTMPPNVNALKLEHDIGSPTVLIDGEATDINAINLPKDISNMTISDAVGLDLRLVYDTIERRL